MHITQLPIVFVHGFGMRGFFWDSLMTAYQNPPNWHAPDLSFSSVLEGRNQLLQYCKDVQSKYDQPLILVGHSLGGILCSLALSILEPNLVSHVVILMAPWLKEKRNPLEKLIGFLIRHRLLPGALVRERFFHPRISKEKQKELFDKAVTEDLDLAYEITTQTWFDSTLFQPNPNISVLGIGSDSDNIVPPSFVRELTLAVGGTFHLIQSDWGHDDIGVDEKSARELIEFIQEHL